MQAKIQNTYFLLLFLSSYIVVHKYFYWMKTQIFKLSSAVQNIMHGVKPLCPFVTKDWKLQKRASIY